MSVPRVGRNTRTGAFALNIVVLLGLAGTCTAASGAIKNVLVIHEGSIQMLIDNVPRHELDRILGANREVAIQLFHEYMDDWTLKPDLRQMAQALRQKYWEQRKPDLIIAVGPSALRLLISYDTEYFDGTPVVFVLNSDHSIAPDSVPSNMTGVSGHFDMAGTIELALRLHPGTRHVFFAGGSSKIEQFYKEIFKQEASPLLRGIEVTYLDGLPFGEMLSRLGKLPEHSLVYFDILNSRVQGYLFPEAASLAIMASNAPVYTSHTPLFGSGVVGGSFFTIERDAQRAAGMALRILKGERPQDIPRETTGFTKTVDWRQIQRWHIAEALVPSGTSISFREPTLWERYKWVIVCVIAICLLQAMLIGGLLIEDARRRKNTKALQVAERALQESEARFRSMADTAPVMIWVSGLDKLCTFFNKAWLEFTGRTMEQELGEGWAIGVHADDLDRCIATYSDSFDARCSFRMEYRLRRADGEYRWILDDGVPRFTADGTFAGFIGSCIDITEVKRLHEEALASQKLESLGQLARGVAHDFNNLLGGVLSTTELAQLACKEGSLPEKELVILRTAAIRGGEIVRQLMTYGGEESLAFEPIDLSLLVEEMLQLLQVSISKNAILETELAKHLPAIKASPAQIRQVVMNLVTNASDAVGLRGGAIRVTTEQARVGVDRVVTGPGSLAPGDYLKLEVSDTGCGMTPEVQSRIFDPFFTTKRAGRGLGLAAVHGILRSHCGAINVTSRLGKGTRIEVLLPCAEQKVEQNGGTLNQASPHQTARNSGTVLVVEDDDTLRVVVSKMLRMEGFSVIEAAEGSAAVDLFRAHEPDVVVVLLDMNLPGMIGPEVFADLRKIRPDVKVIFTSAYGEETIRAAVGGQGWAFIRKPYPIEDLVSLISATQETAGRSHHAASGLS